MRRLLRWVLVLAVVAWVAYTAADAGWSYVATQQLVDEALRNASARHREVFAMGSQNAVSALIDSVRAAILLAAARDGIRMDENDVTVSANLAGLSAAVRWSFPLVSYQSYDFLVIPMSMRRSVGVTR